MSTPRPGEDAATAALRAAVAGEHAAVYAYGVVGARAGAAAADLASTGYAAHSARRDRLAAELAERGAPPELPRPAYALPSPVTGPAAAARLAALVEDRLCTAYGDLVAAAEGRLRRIGADALQDCAVRAALWRGGPVRPFPGDPARR
ncbi:ferritin-like domain-containing protein [Vallicoccus soli]|uniref:DUF4439 domain-containing protein n=1 Tax=Vallicoccus soli TaxID=2339232 RepID=A0A3A3YXU2_9ACTN|nr:ferritin-like domain-containing protein [Vallicoccus soli]RJK96499.1 DUF4439 domain-containing protein [Vallicoccus soli]